MALDLFVEHDFGLTLTTLIDGLNHLSGQGNVYVQGRVQTSPGVYGPWFEQGPFTVGLQSVTVPTAVTECIAGLRFDPVVRTLPLETGPSSLGMPKSPAKIDTQLYQASGVHVRVIDGEGNILDSGAIGSDEPSELTTGSVQEHLCGWDETIAVEWYFPEAYEATIMSANITLES